jgi:ATP synthase protein I
VSDRPPDDGPGNGEARPNRLAELDRRLAAARGAKAPVPGTRRDEYAATSMAWQMVIELIMSIVIGGAMGWGLDTLFGTMPLFLLVFVLLGLAAGVRLMLRTATEMQRKAGRAARKD